MEAWTRADFLKGGAVLVAGGSGLWQLAEAAAAAAEPRPVWHFRSRPDLKPPIVSVLHRSKRTADGLIFIAPSSGPGQRGVLILDDTGEVVFFHPTTPLTAVNFRPAVYRGKPVLTWWQGHAEAGLGVGTHVVLDDSYREITHFPAGDGRQSDLHEFLITPRGTALVTSYEVRHMDTTRWGGGPRGEVVGGVVQELDMRTGRVLFEWRSLDHVGLDESHDTVGRNFFDYFHINSIELAGNGDLVVSARNTWAVYRIDRTTGKVLWRLGGRKSDFRMGKGTVFAWQHDARLHRHEKVISVFDDASDPQVAPQSRALIIALDYERRTAKLVQKFVHRPDRMVSRFMGNAQVLDNGNVMVGWGGEPFLTEFAPDGSIVFDARLPHGGQNYRAFRFPWVGKPAGRPSIAVLRGLHRLYVSWNGATDIDRWALFSGKKRGQLVHRATVPRKGFETAAGVPHADRLAYVVALDRHGSPLGRSETARI